MERLGGIILTVVVYHLLHVFEDLGVATVRLGRHTANVRLTLVKHARRLGVNNEGDRQERLDPFWWSSVWARTARQRRWALSGRIQSR